LISSIKYLCLIVFTGISKSILESLPSTRQRNSLLGVGTNLANFPDDDPKPVVGNLKAHITKRFNIAQHFNETEMVEETLVERENKIPRTSIKENSFVSPMSRSASFTSMTDSRQASSIGRVFKSSPVGANVNSFIGKVALSSSQLLTKSASFHSSPTVIKKPLQVSPLQISRD